MEGSDDAIRRLFSSDQTERLELADLDPEIRAQIQIRLRTLLTQLTQAESAPSFVEDTAKPMPEKSPEGANYEGMLRLMEKTGLLSRGHGEIWEGGGYMWLADGMRLKENIFRAFAAILDGMGYGPFQSPRVLPRAIIDSVIRGIVDLTKGTYWLAEVREGEFGDSGRYANSTNDPVVNYYLGDALRTDPNAFPFKGYSRHQIIRSHTVSRRPLINSDENTDLFEAYSIQETRERCAEEFEVIIATMQNFFRKLGISFLTVDQSMWGNKPVAKKVTSLQAYASPVRGSVRLATMYMHDDTFAKVFGVSKGKGPQKEYAHQVGFGFWEGMFLPLLDHLSDEYGLCIPPEFAPSQIVLVPKDQASEDQALALMEKLGGYRTKIDSDYRKPTQKRLKTHLEAGVPLRVTLQDGKIVFSRRDTLRNQEVSQEQFPGAVPHLFDSMHTNYAQRSRDYAQQHLAEAADTSQVEGFINDRKLVVFNHCGEDDCGKQMEKSLPGEFLGHVREFQVDGCCIGCGNEGKKKGLIGRRAPTP